jgi:hypothetical protein
MRYLKLLVVLLSLGMLSSGAFSQEAKNYTSPSNKWLSAASVVNSHAVAGGIAVAPTRQQAIEKAKQACLENNQGSCTSLGAWNQGCIYMTAGNTPSGAAAYGWGPSAQAAVNACEDRGADCRNQKMINFCLRPQAEIPSTEEVPQISLAPPPEPEAANKPATGIYLPAEDIGSYVVNRKYSEFTLCPDHDKANRCFVFIDGNNAANVSEDQLLGAYLKVSGALVANRSVDAGFTKLNQLRAGTSRVRYHFADLAKGTADGHYEGLMCLTFESEYHKPSPEWQWCGYATEVRARRTGG